MQSKCGSSSTSIEGVPLRQAESPASHRKDKVSEGFSRPRAAGGLTGQEGLCGGGQMAGSALSLLLSNPKPTAFLTSALEWGSPKGRGRGAWK